MKQDPWKTHTTIVRFLFWMGFAVVCGLGSVWFQDDDKGVSFPVTPGDDLGMIMNSSSALEDILASADQDEPFEPFENVGTVVTGGSPGTDLLNMWIRLPLSNESDEERSYILEIDYSWINHAAFYAPDGDGNYQRQERGNFLKRYREDQFPMESTDVPFFEFTLKPGQSEVFYLKLFDRQWFNPSLTLWGEPYQFLDHLKRRDRSIHLYIGLIIGIFLVNGCVFLAFRHRDLLYYLLFLVATSLVHLVNFNMLESGLISPFLQKADVGAYLFGGLLTMSGGFLLLFTAEFLTLEKIAPRLYRLTRGYYSFLLVISPMLVLGPGNLLGSSFLVWVAVFWASSSLLALTLGIYASFRGVRQTRFYIPAILLLLVMAWRFNVSLIYNEVPSNAVMLQWLYASCFEVLVFAFALLDRFRVISREKEEAQAQSYDAIKRHADLQESYNRELSETVAQRTESLREANGQKERLLSYIAHDLRAPLNGLVGLSSLLSKSPKEFSDEEVKSYASEIEVGARAMSELMANLLSWGELQTKNHRLRQQEYLVADIAEAARRAVQSQARLSGVELRFKIADEIYVYCDFTSIVMVLRNLISNGVRFSLEGSVIEVAARSEDSRICLSVSDQGSGLSQEMVDWVNGSDSSDEDQPPGEENGTGLGLKICRHVLGLHHSCLRVASDVDQGSWFSFLLPVPNDDIGSQNEEGLTQ